MQVRLAFSVMVQSDPDVMLIDEVLAVGDAAFQQKCLDVFYRLRGEGKTIVLVTHEMGLVEQFCHRAMMLSGGDITHDRRPARGRARLHERELRHRRLATSRERAARGAAGPRCVDAWIDRRRRRASRRRSATASWMRAARRASRRSSRSSDPGVAMWVTNEDGVRVFSVGARENGEALGDLEPGERIAVHDRGCRTRCRPAATTSAAA